MERACCIEGSGDGVVLYRPGLEDVDSLALFGLFRSVQTCLCMNIACVVLTLIGKC